MEKIKLTKAEIAALDMIIAEMQNDTGTVEAEVPVGTSAAIVRTAIAATRAVVRATPAVARVVNVATAVTEAVGASSQSLDSAKDKVSKEFKDGVSLDQLIEFRKKLK